jgi:hypothetical protein
MNLEGFELGERDRDFPPKQREIQGYLEMMRTLKQPSSGGSIEFQLLDGLSVEEINLSGMQN